MHVVNKDEAPLLTKENCTSPSLLLAQIQNLVYFSLELALFPWLRVVRLNSTQGGKGFLCNGGHLA